MTIARFLIASTGRKLLLILTSSFLVACSSMHIKSPSVSRDVQSLVPDQWNNAAEKQNATTTLGATKTLSDQLLTLFDQPALNQIVREALADNINLRQQALRLSIQQRRSANTQAAQLPSINGQLDTRKNKNELSSNTASLLLSWELDVWGKLAAQSSSAQLTTQAQQQMLLGARNSLAARVIQQWIKRQNQQQVITIQAQQISSILNTETIIKQRYQQGLGSLVDLQSARAASARSEANLLAAQQRLLATNYQLDKLLGRPIEQESYPAPVQLAPLNIAAPNLNKPIRVIEKRTDISSALLRVRASEKNHQATKAAQLPAIKLSANISQSGSSLSELVQASSGWGLLSSITAPLFDNGRLKNNIKIAEFEREIAYLEYRKVVLNALQEVETFLALEISLANRAALLEKAQQASKLSVAQYRQRYSQGLVDILTLLNAQQTYFNDQLQLLNLQRTRLNNRIDLSLALGMGI